MLETKLNPSSFCPLCGCKTGTILQIFNSRNAAIHIYGNDNNTKSDYITKHVEKLWNTNICDYILCDTCSLTYASPFIAGDALFYQMIYDKPIGYSKWKWAFQTTLDKITQHNKQSSSSPITLLEIGAGNGSFVKQISKNIIHPNNILTTEYSVYGKDEIEKLGIKCINAELWDICLPEKKGTFDFICMFQVLEHMENLDKVFNSLSFLIKQNGHLFIAVPNNYNREFFETIGIIEDVPPIHISRWNLLSFKFFANKYGWKIVDYKIEPNKMYKNIAKYLKHKYRNNKIVNKTNNIQNRSIRHLLDLIILSPLFLFNLKCLKFIKNENLGISQWVDFHKD